jgi:glycosyltransferase involved in cell wall biosynthesis
MPRQGKNSDAMTATAPVSVIIPVRNGAAHLGSAIESVLQQQPPPVDVLVIDGNSTDGSAAVASAYASVRLLRQKNLGLAAARNEAIRLCHSPFIGFCDADDRWTEGSLNARLAAFNSDPALLVVIGRVILERLEGASVTDAQQSRIGESLPGFTPGAMLARRQAIESVGWFDESLIIGGDSDWFVRLQQSSLPMQLIEPAVLRKGARGTSLSADVVQYRRELLTIARRYIDVKRKVS